MKTSRKCICIEKNLECFQASVERLCKLLPPLSKKRGLGEANRSEVHIDSHTNTKLLKGPHTEGISNGYTDHQRYATIEFTETAAQASETVSQLPNHPQKRQYLISIPMMKLILQISHLLQLQRIFRKSTRALSLPNNLHIPNLLR